MTVAYYVKLVFKSFCASLKSYSFTFRSAPLQVPPGLTLCQKELAGVAGAFVRLVAYNRSVFGEFYSDILENHVLFKEAPVKREA